MVMIENTENNTVLVQKRVKYWTGVTFPGGHVEKVKVSQTVPSERSRKKQVLI